jgi:putative oxidoreductase
MKLRVLWSAEENNKPVDIALLLFRLLIAGFLLSHGLVKLSLFNSLKEVFPDPLGVGNMISLIMILAAEVGCTILIIFGFLTRLASIPVIFSMIIAGVFIHAGDPFQVKELALLYLGLYVILLITGPGKYSADYYIGKWSNL